MKHHFGHSISILVLSAVLSTVPVPTLAGPPSIPDNPGVPGLLNEIEELQATIEALQAEIKAMVPAPVPQSGQTVSYADGDDGEYQAGVMWPDPRFTDNGDGTVTDHLTGLVWLKNAYCFGPRDWLDALVTANALADGRCGLSDDSMAGDWRLPNIRELHSLIDYSNNDPALPTGYPFINVQRFWYWSSTPLARFPEDTAWAVLLRNGYVIEDDNTSPYNVWPVRGGQ